MERKDTFTRVLDLLGTIFVFLPFIAPLFFSLIRLVESGRFPFDFLMPAEFFFVSLFGGALLIWTAIRAKKWLKLIAWGFGCSIALMAASMGLATLTGLASGTAEAEGWRLALVLGTLVLSYLGMLLCGVGGILLTRDLFKK